MKSNISKNDKLKAVKVNEGVTKDYGNDPFFIQKREKAKETIRKHGLPKGW